ncbi:hypothetical protein K8I31_20325 [bacterium]|nr:hypothetical protein [bacterium]
MENIPIDFSNLDSFMSHQWAVSLRTMFNDRNIPLARAATARILKDLADINYDYAKENGRSAITTVSSRVKTENSFFKKLFKKCNEFKGCITQDTLIQLSESVHDLAGVRFSCPYSDEILPVIKSLVRPKLKELGYGVDLQDDPKLEDNDYLDQGNENGYRSYHFFVEIPTSIDIYGTHKSCLCEIQARSELQHVWAVKSHDLLYKPNEIKEVDEQTAKDMKEISNLLHVADELLISIRKRLEK